MDLTNILEAIEDRNDVKSYTHQEESREAYMQILEEEDPERWIELL